MKEKGFVLGASEDGIVYYRKSKNEYGLEIEQKSIEWLEKVKMSLMKGYGKKSKIRKTKRGYYRLNVYSKDLYNELLGFRKNPGKILEQPKSFRIGFLQGIFDAEGSVRLGRNHITISSNRKSVIKVICSLLEEMKINSGKNWTDKNSVTTIPIYGKENMKKFSSGIAFRHPDKKYRLELLVRDMSCKSPKMVS